MSHQSVITRRDFLGTLRGVAACSIAGGALNPHVAATGVLAATEPRPPRSEAEEIHDRVCLFLDDRFIVEQSGLVRNWHQGRPLSEPAIVGDSWDQWPHLFGSVVYDPRWKLYRMWYSSIREGVFYAESRDGRTWTKPKLGLIDANGSKDNNWIMARVSLPNVILDANEVDPACRYKLFAWDHAFYMKEPKEERAEGHTLFCSADGIRWEPAGKGISGSLLALHERCENFITPDTNQVIWDDLRNRYLATFRTYPKRWERGEFEPGRRRSIGITTSQRITGPWQPVVTSVTPDERDDLDAANAIGNDRSWAELYSMPLFTYGNHYIGLLSLIHIGQGPDGAPVANAIGGGDLQIAFSDDAVKWHRPSERKPLIARVGGSDLHATYAACSAPLEMGDEVWIYYSEQNSSHPTRVDPKSQIRAAAWRRDGFASLAAEGPAPGRLRTKPLRFHGKRLFVNGVGPITVTLLGEQEAVLGSAELTGDSLRHDVSFGGKHLNEMSPCHVARLRFTISEGGRLYSFQTR